MQKIEKDEADIILEILANFEKKLVKESETNLLLSVNAVNGTKANIRYWYLMVVMKGSGFSDISRQLGIMIIFAVALNTWAILNNSKRR